MGIGAIIGGGLLEAGAAEVGIGAGLFEGGAAAAGGFGAAEAGFGAAEAFGGFGAAEAGFGAAEAFGGAELGEAAFGGALGFDEAAFSGFAGEGFADAGFAGGEFAGSEAAFGEFGEFAGAGGEFSDFAGGADLGAFGDGEVQSIGATDSFAAGDPVAEAGAPSSLGEPDPLGTFQGDPAATSTDPSVTQTGTGGDENLGIRDDPYPGEQGAQAARAGGKGAFGSFNPGSLLSAAKMLAGGASKPAALGQASGVASQLQGQANELLSNYNQGLLSAPMMANLQMTLQGNLNKIRQLYRSSGRYNSTDRVQAENQAYLQATASMAQALQTELQQGLAALGQAGQMFGQVANATIASDNAYRSSLNQALGSMLKIPTSGGVGSGGGFPGMNANDTSGISQGGGGYSGGDDYGGGGAENFAEEAA